MTKINLKKRTAWHLEIKFLIVMALIGLGSIAGGFLYNMTTPSVQASTYKATVIPTDPHCDTADDQKVADEKKFSGNFINPPYAGDDMARVDDGDNSCYIYRDNDTGTKMISCVRNN